MTSNFGYQCESAAGRASSASGAARESAVGCYPILPANWMVLVRQNAIYVKTLFDVNAMKVCDLF